MSLRTLLPAAVILLTVGCDDGGSGAGTVFDSGLDPMRPLAGLSQQEADRLCSAARSWSKAQEDANRLLLCRLSAGTGNDLGGAVRSALDRSRTDIPHPTSWTGLLDPLLELAGVKSWSTFAKSALCAEVEEEGGLASVVPTDNLGASGGFQPDPSRATPSEASDLESLGAKVRHAVRPGHQG
jgi:hypothetical protein